MANEKQLKAIRYWYWQRDHGNIVQKKEENIPPVDKTSIHYRVFGRDISPFYKRYYANLKKAQEEKLVIDDKEIAESDGWNKKKPSELFSHATYQYDYFLSRLYHYLSIEEDSWVPAVFMANKELADACREKGVEPLKFDDLDLIQARMPDKYKRNEDD